MERIYHHYNKWEDFKNGMYRKLPKDIEDKLLPEVIKFTGNYTLYGSAMFEVIKHWK